MINCAKMRSYPPRGRERHMLLLCCRSVMSDSFRCHELQHVRLPCPLLSSGACSNSYLLSWWWHQTISSSVISFSCFQSFPASESFPVSWLFASCGQRIWASASAPALPMNIQGWFPLRLTGLISLHAKGLSRVFSNTAVQKHRFFGTQPSLRFNSHIHTWHWKYHNFDYKDLCWQSNVSAF